MPCFGLRYPPTRRCSSGLLDNFSIKVLAQWTAAQKLIWVRLYTQWLLTTLPPDPIEPDLADQLEQIAKSEFTSTGFIIS